MKFIDLTGQRFDRLTIFSFVSKGENKGTRWKCICDCGKEIITTTGQLRSKMTRSCGCLRVDRIRERCGKPEHIVGMNEVLLDYKKRAYYNNISFSLNKEQFINLVQSNCYYCNIEPKIRHRKYKVIANGIDRKDNNIGYEIDNCVPCCKMCNSIKLDYSEEKLFNHLQKMIEVYRKRIV